MIELNHKQAFSLEGRRVYVAGHNGMVGSALFRRLSKEKCEILSVDRKQLDLKDSKAVNEWFKMNKPEVVFFAAARVGGIYANNTYPVDFLLDNLAIQNSVISASFDNEVKKKRAAIVKDKWEKCDSKTSIARKVAKSFSCDCNRMYV